MSSLRQFWEGGYSAGGGPLTQLFSQRLGAIFAYAGYKAKLSPNAITTLGLFVALAGVWLFVQPFAESLIASIILLQLAYGLDCADGQLARASGKASTFGGWWDVAADATNILALSFALLYLIGFDRGSAANSLSILAVFMLTTGRILVLFTSTLARTNEKGVRAESRHSSLKKIIWLVIDTPTFYLFVCILRFYPQLLEAYCLLMGAAFTLNALYLAKTKLS